MTQNNLIKFQKNWNKIYVIHNKITKKVQVNLIYSLTFKVFWNKKDRLLITKCIIQNLRKTQILR